jgi:hypothetical protein
MDASCGSPNQAPTLGGFGKTHQEDRSGLQWLAPFQPAEMTRTWKRKAAEARAGALSKTDHVEFP